jgi:hypothetical protein
MVSLAPAGQYEAPAGQYEATLYSVPEEWQSESRYIWQILNMINRSRIHVDNPL